MDKVPEFISGVRTLLPGIIVATIFYLYSKTQFDQFYFIVFCVISVGLIGVIVDIIVWAAKILFRIILWASRLIWNHFAQVAFPKQKLHTKIENIFFQTVSRYLSSVLQAPSSRFMFELVFAVIFGFGLVLAYESDLEFRLPNRIINTQKISNKDTLQFILDHGASKHWDVIDQRPKERKQCDVNQKDCIDDIYIRIRLKGFSDVYEGAYVYYVFRSERGIYLSPACISRQMQIGQNSPFEPIKGPGVYVNLADALSIEYISIRESDCFKSFNPKWGQKSTSK